MLDNTINDNTRRYWLVSATMTAFKKHPRRYDMMGRRGTPYFLEDSDYSAQLVGRFNASGVERVYWAVPEYQIGKVVEDFTKNTRTARKVKNRATKKFRNNLYAQFSIPKRFPREMREQVMALREGREYKTDVVHRTVLIGV